MIHHDRRTMDDDGQAVSPGTRPFELYENISDYIATFEAKHKPKAVKKKGLEKFIAEDTE